MPLTLHKKWSFLLRISSVNVKKSLLKKSLTENFIFVQCKGQNKEVMLSFLIKISSLNATKSAGGVCAVLPNYFKDLSVKKLYEKEKDIGVNFIGIDIPLKNTCANFQVDMTFFFISHLFENNTFSEVSTYQLIKMNLLAIYCSRKSWRL